MNKIKKIFFFVTKKFSGKRLDILIASKINNIPRSKAKLLILSRYIFVNYTNRKPSSVVRNGELVFVAIKKKKTQYIQKTKYKLKIIYEDADMLIINKKNNTLVHSSHNQKINILVNHVVYYNPNLKNTFLKTNRPGIVHRLDKNTTGIIIVVKKIKAFNNILNQFKNKLMIKKYIAIVYGCPNKNNGLITFSIGRHPVNRKTMCVNSYKQKKAITYWKTVEKYKSTISLLEVNIRTGRTHQVRVHCKKIGHPIIGDKIYNLKNKNYIKMNALFELMLHASKIHFHHPTSKKKVCFETIIPKRFINFVDKTKSKEKN